MLRSRAFLSSSTSSAIWTTGYAGGGVPGFTLRTTTQPVAPVEVMMEQWEKGSSEPPHSHPGDDLTIVVEGLMHVQFFKPSPSGLVKDGAPLVLKKGDTGYIGANRIHDAKYIEHCKLVYVHSGKFGFQAQ